MSKKIILLFGLLILLVGVVNAMDVSNDTNVDTSDIIVEKTQHTTDNVEENIIKEQVNNYKVVKDEKNIKCASKTYDVTNFNTLQTALRSNDYETVVLNIKSNIILEDNTNVNRAINNLKINGNGKTIDGNGRYRFIQIEKCALVMNNIKIMNCYSTGGSVIYAFDSTIQINNSNLNNNHVIHWDGGVIDAHQSVLVVSNSILNNNHAGRAGGAINCYQTAFLITNSKFINNSANSEGGAIYTSGQKKSYILNSTLKNNQAHAGGGALYTTITSVSISNCIINNNFANYSGGAIESSLYSVIFIENSQINENMVKYSNGGAIYSIGGNLSIINSSFYKNKAKYSGGAIYGIDTAVSTTTILINNTFIQNEAGDAGNAIVNNGRATIRNNINDKTSKYSSTIYTGVSYGLIENNTFKDNYKDKTKVLITTVKGILGEKITLAAQVMDSNNNKINEGNVIFKLNGITLKSNGKLTGSNSPLKVKVINGIAKTIIVADLNMRNAKKITAHYIENTNYYGSTSNTANMQISQRNASIVVTSNMKKIKHGQTLTITAKIYDTTNSKSTNILKYSDEFVYFKINGITLKDSNGQMLKVKIVNGTATTTYKIPLGLSGITNGKTMMPKNHIILVGFSNKNYKEDIRNTTSFQVERSNITISLTNAIINTKTHKLSMNVVIKDYLGNIVSGPNKCVIKINGLSLKNKTQPIYYYTTNGRLYLNNINIPSYNKYTTIELVTQDRLAYKSQRNKTSVIRLVN